MKQKKAMAAEVTQEDIEKMIVGKWIVAEVDGQPASTNLKSIFDIVSNTHAAKISEKLGLTEDAQKSQSFSMGPEEEMTFRIILETRYHMMGILAQDSGFSVFVDLPCGYTPRAIETAEHSSSYIGLDLPPVISEISGIILPMISSEKQSLVRFNPVDATNGRSLEKADLGFC